MGVLRPRLRLLKLDSESAVSSRWPPPSMAAPIEAFPAGEPATGGRHSHVSFPLGDPSSDVDSYHDPSSIGLGLPPPLRHVSTGFDAGDYQGEGRRRVRSVHGAGALSGRLQPPRHAQTMRRRTLTTVDPVKSLRADKRRSLAGSIESSMDELEPGVFSDEYDLCEGRYLSCIDT